MSEPPAVFPLVRDVEALERTLSRASGVLVYFTGPDCGVCDALRPRVAALLAQRFPGLEAVQVDCSATPELAARHRVFAVPTVLAFFEGREWARKSRSFSLAELEAALERPYGLLFDDTP